ncbi:MAG: hypothetical protein IT368_07160, partial [Candidatus Hydrogenedentes bacterium]|nr:hypothetical protein [Candidatus Hydrogenedentota bacterium]
MQRRAAFATVIGALSILLLALAAVHWNTIRLMIKEQRTIAGAQREFAPAEERVRDRFATAG